MPAPRTGFLAGGIAVLVALLVLRIASEILIPFNFLLDFISDSVLRNLVNQRNFFINYIFGGTDPVGRILPFIIVGYIVVGGVLGVWANGANLARIRLRSLAGAAVLFSISYAIVILGGGHYATYYQSEIIIGLMVSFLAFAATLMWLLKDDERPMKWSLGGLVALISLGFIIGEVWLDNPM